MNELDNQLDFGISIEATGEGRSKTFPEGDYMKRYLETYMAHGGLFDQAQAARMAGVSKVRIGQLVKAGKLPTVTLSVETPAGPLLIEETIAGNDLRAWMEAPKAKGGRPMHRIVRQELQAA